MVLLTRFLIKKTEYKYLIKYMILEEKHFVFDLSTHLEGAFISKSEAPSNIALVKYWGKKENQIPANPSISFTLNNCKTITNVEFIPSDELTFEVWSGNNRLESFDPKIKVFLHRILPYCKYLNNLKIKIDTSNTFPHSSGIASSASGLSALSLCIMQLEKELNPSIEASFFMSKASFLARLGSGSAARSVFNTLASWGIHKDFEYSSDLYATPFTDAHEVFQSFQDSILIIDEGQKKVSSTVGHNLMHGHPFAENRFKQAHQNLSLIKTILKSGDLNAFIEIVESEALTLHAMMMASNPYFILMKPNTLKAIEKIWEYRKSKNNHICFTLDAGANVHVLYPESEKVEIQMFINEELAPLCENNKVIHDFVKG